jgi:hypothetical protein
MDFLTFITSEALREISATAVLVGVFVLIVTGRLVPRRVHLDTIKERDAWHDAHTRSEDVRAMLNQENFKLLESARIADSFYRDFLPPIRKNGNGDDGSDA